MMRIEFFPDGALDCPAILFYGCPSACAEALIGTFRSLAEGPETEVGLHQVADLFAVGNVQVFATNGSGRTVFSNCHRLYFAGERTKKDGLKPQNLLSRWPAAIPVKEAVFSTSKGTGELMLSSQPTGRGNCLLTRRLSRRRAFVVNELFPL